MAPYFSEFWKTWHSIFSNISQSQILYHLYNRSAPQLQPRRGARRAAARLRRAAATPAWKAGVSLPEKEKKVKKKNEEKKYPMI